MKIKFSLGQIMAFLKIEKNFVNGMVPIGSIDNWMHFVLYFNLKGTGDCTFARFDYLNMIPRQNPRHLVIEDLARWKNKLHLRKL